MMNKKYLISLIIFLFLFPTFSIKAQVHWESMIIESDTWKYLPATSEPPSDWMQLNFSDNAWSSAIGGIGYGDGDDATVISACNSLYLRKKVNIADVSSIKDLLLDIDYDDAFVLYVNGTEYARSTNVSGKYPAYNAALTVDHEAKMYMGGLPERFQLNPSLLVNGENIIAVQILNYGISSSDLSSRVYVEALILGTETIYHPVPSWFVAPVSTNSSNLPMVFVNTNGQNIIENSKIMVEMKTLNSPYGINFLADTTFEYNGMAGIEIRGFTSSGYPKKSYTVETRNVDESNNNVPLLGLPEENDWVFHGPYADKSLMRNVLAYHLGNMTGKWSPRTRFFELYLNDAYNGLYVLVEKIKNDKNRLNLAKLKDTDTIGDDLTGGYILKLDRAEWTDVEGINYWISPYRANTAYQQKEYFIFQDPKGDEMLQVQRDYIRTYITDFEDALHRNDYTDLSAGYYPYVDLQSFVDYYIITELSRNLDGYRISTFLHKDKDSKGGKLTMGPFWDYNICFGNANFFSAGNTNGWVIDGMGDGDAYAMPFWWEKFRLDPYFNSTLKKRWNELTESCINTTYLNNFIDSCANVLSEAQVRNFTKWNVLNTWVWPNNYVGGNYPNELLYLKNWLRDRITWMNTQIQAIPDFTGVKNTYQNTMDLVTYPNPFKEDVHFKFYLPESGNMEISIINSLGQKVYQKSEFIASGFHDNAISLSKNLTPGVYMYQVLLNGQLRSSGKLIKQ